MREENNNILFYCPAFPADIISYILSFLDPYTAFRIRHVSTPLLKWSLSCSQLSSFHSGCFAIEADRNYIPTYTNQDFLSWSVYYNTGAYTKPAIDTESIIIHSPTRFHTGKAYNIISPYYNNYTGLWYMHTYIHLIKFDGSIQLYSTDPLCKISNHFIFCDINTSMDETSFEEEERNHARLPTNGR